METVFGVKLRDLNAHLVCVICGGYLIEAMTVVECLHSFCRVCIARYLETSKCCPICDVQVHKARPHINIREDKTLQDLVYKLVPGLYHREVNRRSSFSLEHPASTSSYSSTSEYSSSDDEIPTKRDVINCDYPTAIGKTENISVCLQLCDRSPPFKNSCSTTSPQTDNDILDKKYLLCPAIFPLGLMKKFLQAKFNLNQAQEVEFYFSDESLSDICRLMDIAYIYNWKQFEPLKLFYIVQQQPTDTNTQTTTNTSIADNTHDEASTKSTATKSHKSSKYTHKKRRSPTTSSKLSPTSLKVQSPASAVTLPIATSKQSIATGMELTACGNNTTAAVGSIQNQYIKDRQKSKTTDSKSKLHKCLSFEDPSCCEQNNQVRDRQNSKSIDSKSTIPKCLSFENTAFAKVCSNTVAVKGNGESKYVNPDLVTAREPIIESLQKRQTPNRPKIKQIDCLNEQDNKVTEKANNIGSDPRQNNKDCGLLSNECTSTQRSALVIEETGGNKQQQTVLAVTSTEIHNTIPQPTNVNKQIDQSVAKFSSQRSHTTLSTNSSPQHLAGKQYGNPGIEVNLDQPGSIHAASHSDQRETTQETSSYRGSQIRQRSNSETSRDVSLPDCSKNHEQAVVNNDDIKSAIQTTIENVSQLPETHNKTEHTSHHSPTGSKCRNNNKTVCQDANIIDDNANGTTETVVTAKNVCGLSNFVPSPRTAEKFDTPGNDCKPSSSSTSPNKGMKSVEVQTDSAPEADSHSLVTEQPWPSKNADSTLNTNKPTHKTSYISVASPKSPDSSTGPIPGKPSHANRRRKTATSNFARKYRLPSKSNKTDGKSQTLLKGAKLGAGSKVVNIDSDPYSFDDTQSGVKSKRVRYTAYCDSELSRPSDVELNRPERDAELSRPEIEDEPVNRNALDFLEEYVNFVNHGDERSDDIIPCVEPPVSNSFIIDKSSTSSVGVIGAVHGNYSLPKAYIPLKDIVTANVALQNRISQGINIRTISSLYDARKNHYTTNVKDTSSSHMPIQEHSIKSSTEHKHSKKRTKKIPPLKLKITKPDSQKSPKRKNSSDNKIIKKKKKTETMDNGQPRIFLRISKANIPAVKRSLSVNFPIVEKSAKKQSPKGKCRRKSDTGETSYECSFTECSSSSVSKSTKTHTNVSTARGTALRDKTVDAKSSLQKQELKRECTQDSLSVPNNNGVARKRTKPDTAIKMSSEKPRNVLITSHENSLLPVSVGSDKKQELSRIDKIKALEQDLHGRSPQSGLDLLSRASEKFSPIPEAAIEHARYTINDDAFTSHPNARTQVQLKEKLNRRDVAQRTGTPSESTNTTTGHPRSISQFHSDATKATPDSSQRFLSKTEIKTKEPTRNVPLVLKATTVSKAITVLKTEPTKIESTLMGQSEIVNKRRQQSIDGIIRHQHPLQSVHNAPPSPLVTLGMYVGARQFLQPHISYHGLVYPLNGLVMVGPATRPGQLPQRALSLPDIPNTPIVPNKNELLVANEAVKSEQNRENSAKINTTAPLGFNTIESKPFPSIASRSLQQANPVNPAHGRTPQDHSHALALNVARRNPELHRVLTNPALLPSASHIYLQTKRPGSEPPSSHKHSLHSSQAPLVSHPLLVDSTVSHPAVTDGRVALQANGYDAPLELTTKKSQQPN